MPNPGDFLGAWRTRFPRRAYTRQPRLYIEIPRYLEKHLRLKGGERILVTLEVDC